MKVLDTVKSSKGFCCIQLFKFFSHLKWYKFLCENDIMKKMIGGYGDAGNCRKRTARKRKVRPCC